MTRVAGTERWPAAGLGLLAKRQFAAAARCYSPCKDTDRAKLNQERWSAVSTSWEEPESK